MTEVVPTQHAKLSPSGAHRWSRCPGSVLAESLVPNYSSEYAEEGTVAHEVAALTLQSEHKNAEAFLGRIIEVGDNPEKKTKYEVTQEMCDYVQEYVNEVMRAFDQMVEEGEDPVLLVEQRLDFSDYFGIPDQSGTGDAVIVGRTKLRVHDLKYGRGVAVYAEDNEQLLLYGLGALEEHDMAGTIEEVTVAIHMPRKYGMSEWTVDVIDVYAVANKLRTHGKKAMDMLRVGETLDHDELVEYLGERDTLIPGKKQCQWCNFKAQCPALGNEVINIVTRQQADTAALGNVEGLKVLIEEDTKDLAYDSPEVLAAALEVTDLVDLWVKAVRERSSNLLQEGVALPGFKLVRGRKGPRQWVDKKQAEELLKSMRLKQHEMYSFAPISPTKAEELLKDSPRRWNRLKAIITQSDGSLSVAPDADPRPAVVVEVAKDDELAPSGLTVEDLV